MIEKLLAAAIVAVCALMLVRLVIGERRRWRFDAAVRKAWRTWRQRASAIRHWRSSRRHARTVADEAIRRARGGVEQDGNVYKPKSFRGPRKPH